MGRVDSEEANLQIWDMIDYDESWANNRFGFMWGRIEDSEPFQAIEDAAKVLWDCREMVVSP